MKNLTANQIILLFQFYTGEDFIKSHTFSNDADVLIERGLASFNYGMISFHLTYYGEQYCEKLIAETTKP